MTSGHFEINGKTFTRTLTATQHLGRLIADIDAVLNDEREPTAMAKLLDERLVSLRAHGQLVDSMCEATRTEATRTETPAASVSDKLRMLDLLALDALSNDLDAQIATAASDKLTGLNFRQNAVKRMIGALRDVAQAPKAPTERA
jgi:hypothetical protein